jgi:hypothetical protein
VVVNKGIKSTAVSTLASAMTSKEQAKRRFEEVFTSIVDEVTDFVAQTKISEDAVKWYRENLIYNTLGGKLNRGLSVIDTYSILTGKTELSDEEYKRVAVLGWCIELVSAYSTALLIRRALISIVVVQLLCSCCNYNVLDAEMEKDAMFFIRKPSLTGTNT